MSPHTDRTPYSGKNATVFVVVEPKKLHCPDCKKNTVHHFSHENGDRNMFACSICGSMRMVAK